MTWVLQNWNMMEYNALSIPNMAPEIRMITALNKSM